MNKPRAMRLTIIISLFLFSCDSSKSRYGFKTGDEVLVDGRYNGIVTKAKHHGLKEEYICVTWISECGEEYDCVHYKLLKKK